MQEASPTSPKDEPPTYSELQKLRETIEQLKHLRDKILADIKLLNEEAGKSDTSKIKELQSKILSLEMALAENNSTQV
jgi:hypothetical protein